MRISEEVAQIMDEVFLFAKGSHFEYVTPELVLYVICKNKVFAQAFQNCGGEVRELDASLREYIEEYMESCPEDTVDTPKTMNAS